MKIIHLLGMSCTISLFYRFFTRIDKVLRRSLGVSELAQGEAKVKPAPVRGNNDIDTPTTENILSDELKSKVSVTSSY